RHTRFSRDWSSDVCSSDLSETYLDFGRLPRRIVIGGDNDRPELLADTCRAAQVLVHEATYTQPAATAARDQFGHSTAAQVAAFRSEERRVGKEGSQRGARR